MCRSYNSGGGEVVFEIDGKCYLHDIIGGGLWQIVRPKKKLNEIIAAMKVELEAGRGITLETGSVTDTELAAPSLYRRINFNEKARA